MYDLFAQMMANPHLKILIPFRVTVRVGENLFLFICMGRVSGHFIVSGILLKEIVIQFIYLKLIK